jgi:hypothetical protein
MFGFGKREKHTHAAWLICMGSGGRTLCQIVFWLWGLGGLVVFGAPAGLLVFGIGGVLQTSDYDFKRPVDTIHLGE